MKVDEIIREKLVKNLKDYLSEFNTRILTLIEGINDTDTIEELMYLKKEILIRWIERLPIQDTICYFCLINGNCSSCKYAERHKVCLDSNSTWYNISRSKIDLLNIIETYYLGESYNNKKSPERKTFYCHNCGSKFRRITNTSNKECGNCYELLYEYK